MKKEIILIVLLVAVLLAGCLPLETETPATIPTEQTQPTTQVTTEPAPVIETGFLAGLSEEIPYCDENGTVLGTLLRGTQVDYIVLESGVQQLQLADGTAYLQEGSIVSDETQVIPTHTLYVRTAVTFRDVDGKLLEAFADKGTAVEIQGFDYLEEGKPHMYRTEQGYIMPWYLTDTEENALANYDDGDYATHADRSNRYGGGSADNLDYYPREKGPIQGNDMPQECRTLYIAAWRVTAIDEYIAIAEQCDINAFVIDIVDGSSVGYAGEVMQSYAPSAAAAANNSMEDYKAAITKLKEKGYYVIGRITTFNDSYFITDHPEYAITDPDGNPLKLSGNYWPTPYNRTAWQYKVDLAVEAVELMGFNEIQFDYVRFPDLTYSYEKNGTIDFHDTYGETKAQAIQRFLMYATDILHEHGAYVSADVYGESAYNYVTAYGQYWPAISNVVDVISGMPYPDHFAESGDYRPWEHPYDTL